LTAKPADGYAFERWTGEVGDIADPSQNPVTFAIGDNPDTIRSITAEFTKTGLSSSSWVSSYWWLLVIAGIVAIGGLFIVLIFGLLIFLRRNRQAD